MTHRERFVRTMHFQSVDRVPDWEFGYWSETLEVWHQQGLPAEVDHGNVDRFFGFEPSAGVPAHISLHPPFESKVLEETQKYKIVVDGDGVTSQVFTDGSSTIPHYLRFPLETREDWEKTFKPRLDPDDPVRIVPDEDWEKCRQQWANRDVPLFIGIGSLFGWIRNWMGPERACITCMDDPAWMEEMMEHLCNLIVTVLERAFAKLEGIQVDAGSGWEDMCFNKGPLISPRLFKQLMVPRYRRITDLLKKHGVDVAWIDCDGNINELVPLFLEGGINCMFPLEVRGGSDPIPIRRKYGKEVLLIGGVDKTKLAEGKRAILDEVKRLEPLVAEGGFIPHVDHRCPPDVSYENYLFYLKTKREAFGIPEPAPWEERKG